jgi:sigma-B regulation protein RsbU (phosphoserine phosphatase)
LLGAFADVSWQDVVIELEPGSTLMAYTDGITDAVGKDGRRFGLERLCATLSDVGDRPSTEVIDRLRGVLTEYQTEIHADDTAAIVLRRVSDSREPPNCGNG